MPTNERTEAVKQCHRCGTGLPGGDKFCRSCGISQMTAQESRTPLRTPSEEVTLSSFETSQLLSGVLIPSLTRALSIKTAPFRSNKLGSRVIAALTLIPIWLLIILLSPLDAYTAARAAASQLNYE